MSDKWMTIEPQSHGYRELPGDPAVSAALLAEMARIQYENGARWFRYTVVTPESPNPPYPHGLYCEGWDENPARMDPPRTEANFRPPLTPKDASHD